MAIEVRYAIIKDVDVISDDHCGAMLYPIIKSSGIRISGTGRMITAKTCSSMFDVTGCNSMREIKHVPVRVALKNNILIGIGSYEDDKWCHLPSGGALMSMDELKKYERETEVLIKCEI